MDQDDTMHMKLKFTIQKIYSYIFAVLFFGMLLAPVFKSGWTFQTFDTSFNWHKELVRLYNSTRIMIKDSVFPGVLVGKNGWLFYTGNNAISDYQGLGLAKQKDLQQLQQSLDKINVDLQQQGITLIVVIAPNKESIYPQFMPVEIHVFRKKSRIDQFVDYMQLYGETNIIDLRPVMQDASKSQQIYFKTDTHWNQYGAYLAYREIFSSLSKVYPALQAYQLSDYEITLGNKSTRDLVNILGISNIEEADWNFLPKFFSDVKGINIPLGNRNVQLTFTSDQTLPSIVIFHDSFFLSLSHFFEPHFNKMVLVPYPNEEVWNLKWIDQLEPDIVIIELAERYLWELPELLSTY